MSSSELYAIQLLREEGERHVLVFIAIPAEEFIMPRGVYHTNPVHPAPEATDLSGWDYAHSNIAAAGEDFVQGNTRIHKQKSTKAVLDE